ncbi:neutral alpha-glucosidase AB isoform X2 [Lingula anatina]|uniref:Neutral alpha-glucosidase AB n=1 Tax=Lingula anatina TaxID=7574 RepID=A0A1S3IM02_LINAN|nr:neutral alpha-glucosidase AB isoform X2 [Lingula anatina]|eukprot:XP_013399270.1 neutral alpha-glucosidase AB isoform X2 [Lingula anatina]
MALSMRSTVYILNKVLVVGVLLSYVASVDKSNFKTCDQSGFCKRQRAYKPDQSPYVALLDSVQIEPTKMKVQLLNTQNQVRLLLEVIGLERNMARVKINELNPIKPRYEIPVGDVLIGDPKQDKIEISHKDGGSISLAFQSNKIVLQSKPFRIDFVASEHPVVSLNANGLLKFEHLRLKTVTQEEKKEGDEKQEGENQEGQGAEERPEGQEQAAEEEKEPEAKEPEEPDMWEESFKGHSDSKPNGPTSVGIDISFPGFEQVYGIPEHADSLALRSTKDMDPYRLYNLDVFEYELDSPAALYGAVPVMLAHNEKQTVGVFWQNPSEAWIDISHNLADKSVLSKVVDFVKGGDQIPQVDTHWFFESGIVDIFIMLGPGPADVFKQYAALTGTTPLPPMFALAYHQSRWNYNDEEDVSNVDANFDKHDIPYDVIWLDIEHTDGKRYFTWDKSKFPNPEEMVRNISAKGRKMVTIVDPHIKKDDHYKIYKECRDLGHFIKNKDGNDYDGWCWPGSSSWPDFTKPAIRQYWASKFAVEEYEGSTLDLHTWNDMNEPSVFNGPEITMHKDAKHDGGWEHRDVHNIYGMFVHQATVEGMVARTGGLLRPFVLSRAFFAGSQRWGAVWTGDNTGEWGHLKVSMPMILSLSITGITFSGADVGGFFKNPDSELLTRWYQAAAYQPFFRAHAHLDTRRREPWLLPEENMKVIRQAIRERYALLPYWYTLFYKAEKDGGPVMRPLWVEFPSEKGLFKEEETFMIGDALMVRPVTAAGTQGVNVFFPGGTEQYWYDTDTTERVFGGAAHYVKTPLDKIPTFQRGGSIIPKKERIRRASNLGRHDPYTLVVALDRKGSARGDLYIDDYHTFHYRKGDFIYREFIFKDKVLENKNGNPGSTFTTPSWLEKVIIMGLSTSPSAVTISSPKSASTSLGFTYDSVKMILTIRKPAVNIAEDWTISIQ